MNNKHITKHDNKQSQHKHNKHTNKHEKHKQIKQTLYMENKNIQIQHIIKHKSIANKKLKHNNIQNIRIPNNSIHAKKT